MKREELERQLKELKEKLREEKRKERLKKINEYRKNRYKQKVFYVPKEIEDKEYYIFLKLAKKLGINTFEKNSQIYNVDDELKKIEKEFKKENG